MTSFGFLLTCSRLGLFERDLAFRFSISEQLVSDITITWANHLYLMPGSLLIWSYKEQIKQHLPEAFKGEFENIMKMQNRLHRNKMPDSSRP